MEEIAAVYARSLFEVASEHGVLDETHTELAQFVDELANNREFQVFFFSPYFSSQEKKEGIRKSIEGGNEHLLRFLEALCDRHRMPVLFRIRQTFDSLWEQEQKLLPVSVTSALDLDEQLVAEIARRIEDNTGNRVELTRIVDPEILGGLVLRVGNTIIDASVRNRLERLRKQVATAA